ncbi:MAG: hypothetical protein ABL986_17740 [Vicinamibacterales bacterium]
MRWSLYVAAFVLTALFRFLTLGDGFPNDHYVYISGGWQMLAGEWPTRDWVDPGLPLMFAVSAAAQAVFGKVLFAEAVLVSVAFGAGAALTAAAVLEVTGTLWIAALATLLEVVVFPRTYGYPKVLVYAAVFLCCARFVSRPGHWRAVLMAFAVVVAFLFRHDHGLFLGVGCALTILLAPDSGTLAQRSRTLALFVLAGLLMVAPYLLYVQLNGGLPAYIRAGVDFSEREAARQWHIWPAVFGDDKPFQSALVYEFYAIPVLALIVLVAQRFGGPEGPPYVHGTDPPYVHRGLDPPSAHRIPQWSAHVIPAAIVALLANYYLVRDPLDTRVADAIVPAVMLGAWLAARAVQATRHRTAALGVLALSVALFGASVSSAGSIVENLDRTDVRREWDHLPRLFMTRSAELHERFSTHQIPTRATLSLVPFFGYLDRCTADDHRLIVGGYLVELPFFAQRRFAGGMGYLGGSFGGDETERLTLLRLRTQVAPFAVIPSDYMVDLEGRFPRIVEYLRARYTKLADVHVTDELDVNVFVDTTLAPVGRDRDTGWPCFR